MTEVFIQMGKRGTIVIPAKMRKKLSMVDGCLLLVSETEGAIRLRLAKVLNPDADSRLKLAQRLLSGAEDLGSSHTKPTLFQYFFGKFLAVYK